MVNSVIILSGIDGSGKTAHARDLIEHLKSNSIPVKYSWMRGRGKVVFSFPLLVFCRLFRITKVYAKNNGNQISDYPFYAYPPLRLIWPWLQFVDSSVLSLKNRLSVLLSLNSTTIIDRSVVDTLVDIIADTHTPVGIQLLHRLLLSLIPKNSTVIILDVSERVAMSRKSDILGMSYIKPRRKLYKQLAKNNGWSVVSTNQDYNTVHKHLAFVLFNNSKIMH